MSRFHVAVPSRWFPPILALLQTVRHLAMIGHTYKAQRGASGYWASTGGTVDEGLTQVPIFVSAMI